MRPVTILLILIQQTKNFETYLSNKADKIKAFKWKTIFFGNYAPKHSSNKYYFWVKLCNLKLIEAILYCFVVTCNKLWPSCVVVDPSILQIHLFDSAYSSYVKLIQKRIRYLIALAQNLNYKICKRMKSSYVIINPMNHKRSLSSKLKKICWGNLVVVHLCRIAVQQQRVLKATLLVKKDFLRALNLLRGTSVKLSRIWSVEKRGASWKSPNFIFPRRVPSVSVFPFGASLNYSGKKFCDAAPA